MDIFDIIAILFTLSALFSYLNHRFIKLPPLSGVMLISLVISLTFMILWHFGVNFEEQSIHELIGSINFEKIIFGGLLGLLLFAGALTIDINYIHENKWEIAVLAILGVILSTFIVGSLVYLISSIFHLDLSYMICLLFGALISPTDPIAVIGILKRLGIPKDIEVQIAGESLFNDGIGVVVFITLFDIVVGGRVFNLGSAAVLLTREVMGGILFGFAAGLVGYKMLKDIDNYVVEILITIALAIGGYVAASSLHISGPLAMVIAGLLIGNHGRQFAMSEKTRENLDKFWELVDEILNILLFVLIGIEVIIVPMKGKYLSLMLLVIPIVLIARLLSVAIPLVVANPFKKFSANTISILTWGGIRGGISVALALSIPKDYHRDIILAMTYSVVVFSILVQSTTLGLFIKNTKQITLKKSGK